MSAEARKNCRLQGKYSDKYLEDRKSRKSLEKRLKESPTEKETQEKKFIKRKSDGTKEGTSFSSENKESQLEYQENSEHSFSKLEERKKPIEIKKPGKFVLSNTENGESSVLYEPNFYAEDEAWDLFDFLYESTKWLDKNIVIHGVEYPQPRLVAWYGPLPYSYSGTTLEPAEMPDCVLAIKRRVEDYLKGHNIDVELNSVLLNLYRNNKDSVSWHSDDEFTMGVCPTIASISLGETRRFEMRPKSNRYYEDDPQKKENEHFVHLNNGSLIIMDGCMQEDWQHRVPKEYHDRNMRINLTFRTVYKFENGSPYSDSRVNNHKPVDGEIPKNPSRIKIDLEDEENFPPLSFVSSSVNSKTARKPYEKAGSSQIRIEIDTNKTSEKELKINHPSYKSLSKINDRISDPEEQWTVETPPSNKTTSRINYEINASEEEWVVETPPSNKTTSRINDKIMNKEWIVTPLENYFEANDFDKCMKEWDVEPPPYPKPSTKSNDTVYESKENFTIKSLPNNRAYPEADNKVNRSENRDVKQTFSNRAPPDRNISNTSDEEWIINSPVKNNSNSQFPEINKSHYSCYEESASNSRQLTPPESDNKSHKDWYEESCNSEIWSESDDINELHEERHEKSFDRHQQTSLESNKIYHNRSSGEYFKKSYHRQPPLEYSKFNENRNGKSFTRPNRVQSDKYHEERAAKPFSKRNVQSETNRYHRYNERGATKPFYDNNASRQEKNFKSNEVNSFENHNIERSTVSNNEKKYVKIEISNENMEGYEQRSGQNQHYNSKERKNGSSNFAVHSMRKHFSDIRNEPVSNRSNGWRPNVKAVEFVPGKMKNLPSKVDTFSSSVENSLFGHFSLEDLLNYDSDRMPSDELKNYANALKLRVLDRISEFKPSDNEELEVLCEITDGNQTDKNQKIICSRICALVNRTITNKQRNHIINPPKPRVFRQANYGNENHHHSDRRYHDSS